MQLPTTALKHQPPTTIMQSFAHLIAAVASLLTMLLSSVCAEPMPQNTSEPLAVFLLDDQTGEELAAKHGIQPIATADLEVLVNGVLQNRTPVRLAHQAVDEDATDNAVTQMEFRPYAGGTPPTAPSPALPLRQLAEAMKKWRQERAAWQQGMISYRRDVIAQSEGFVKRVASTQLEVAQRFDQMLADRNGRDFNRSDIFGSITAANAALGSKGRRVLILNTDGVDLPGKRAPRKLALTPAQLDPSVEIIFVNTSQIPDRGTLFAGIKNPARHANSMREAMEMVVAMLGGEEGKGSPIAGK
jgi:hypothetical protein